MKTTLRILSLVLCLPLLLCGCFEESEESVPLSDYESLQSDNEYLLEERDNFEYELSAREDNVELLLRYINSEQSNSIPTFAITDTWTVDDCFSFSFYYKKSDYSDDLCYKLKDKNGKTFNIDNVLIGSYYSSGEIEFCTSTWEGDYALWYLPEENYSLKLIVWVPFYDNIYCAAFETSCDEIRQLSTK